MIFKIISDNLLNNLFSIFFIIYKTNVITSLITTARHSGPISVLKHLSIQVTPISFEFYLKSSITAYMLSSVKRYKKLVLKTFLVPGTHMRCSIAFFLLSGNQGKENLFDIDWTHFHSLVVYNATHCCLRKSYLNTFYNVPIM